MAVYDSDNDLSAIDTRGPGMESTGGRERLSSFNRMVRSSQISQRASALKLHSASPKSTSATERVVDVELQSLRRWAVVDAEVKVVSEVAHVGSAAEWNPVKRIRVGIGSALEAELWRTFPRSK
jgi:hypothetical protein